MNVEICFEGVGQTAATFAVSGQVEPGMAVTITKSGTVSPGKDGDALCGVALGRVRNGAAAVQIGGAARVSCSGTVPPGVGWQELVCDGKGGVRTAGGQTAQAAQAETGDGAAQTAAAQTAAGVSWLVLAADEDGKSIIVKL